MQGISLCIGQKIRICIARALYSKADLVILVGTASDRLCSTRLRQPGINWLMKDLCVITLHIVSYIDLLSFVAEFPEIDSYPME